LVTTTSVGRHNAKGSSSASRTASHEPTSVTRRAASSPCSSAVCSTQAGSPRSTTRRHPSAGCSALASHGTGCCAETGGRSINWKAMSSKHSMPGWGDWVVNGYGSTSACEPVSRACRADFPEFGGPSSATWPAPSRRTTVGGPVLAPPLPGRGELLGEVLDAGLDVAPEMLGAPVLGDRAEHLPRPAEPVLEGAGLAELGLRGLVLGREIGRHLPHHGRPSETSRSGDARAGTTGGADHQLSARERRRAAAVTPRPGGG
jgi:hypothetical protein